jgi:hypothetical protein
MKMKGRGGETERGRKVFAPSPVGEGWDRGLILKNGRIK